MFGFLKNIFSHVPGLSKVAGGVGKLGGPLGQHDPLFNQLFNRMPQQMGQQGAGMAPMQAAPAMPPPIMPGQQPGDVVGSLMGQSVDGLPGQDASQPFAGPAAQAAPGMQDPNQPFAKGIMGQRRQDMSPDMYAW